MGEVVVRLGAKLADELEEKVRLLRRSKPEMLRPKLVKVISTDYTVPSAVEAARERGIWVLKWER